MRRFAVLALLLAALPLLGGCSGGQEIEDCLFVIAMAVDPAQEGSLTVTVKALSGTQDAATPQDASSAPDGGMQDESGADAQGGAGESTEPGYVVMSATAGSCLAALNLLGATTPRTVNLSQLKEIVIARTLAETPATLTILKEIYALYEANGNAVVVVTPDDAGDLIRRQYAMFGVRLSQYLQVLFDHFEELGTVPPDANLASVIAAMESGMRDAAAVYAAANDFSATLMLAGDSPTDRLPGHLPRTSPAQNEYLGSALFSGPRMTGVLTGEETGLLCLLLGRPQQRTVFIGGAQYKTSLKARTRRSLSREDGALTVSVRMTLTRVAGEADETAAYLARQIEQRCVQVLQRLQAASCDAVGFGRIAVRSAIDIPAWEARGWPDEYERLPVRVTADIRLL